MNWRTGKPTRQDRRASAVASTMLILALSLGGVLALVRMVQTIGIRAGLQDEADETALAVAAALARQSEPEGPRLSATAAEVALGRWDAARRRFVAASSSPNAVEVTVRGSQAAREVGRGWLSRIVSPPPAATATSAVAAVRPRDIVFVVDLSSAMAAESLAAAERLQSRQDSIQANDAAILRGLYQDMGYESFPGPDEPLGAPWGASWDALAAGDGPLSHAAVPAKYRIEPGDPISVRREKACSAVIDHQILRLMPRAMPDPQRPENRRYWAAYLDDLSGSKGSGAKIGYASYLCFMLRRGRIEQAQGQYVPLSQHSRHCPWHLEQVGGDSLRFPPRVEPMHQVRRALAEAICSLAKRNGSADDPASRDRVAIVSLDWPSGAARVQQTLTSDYGSAVRACARLQPVGVSGPSSQPQPGLRLADQLLREASSGMYGWRGAEKMLVLVTSASTDCARGDGPLQAETPPPDHVVCIGQGDAQVRGALERIINAAPVALVR